MGRNIPYPNKLQTLRLPAETDARLEKIVADGYALSKTEFMRMAILTAIDNHEKTHRQDRA